MGWGSGDGGVSGGGCGGGVIVILVVVALASNRPVSLLSDPCYKLLILPACFNLSTSLLKSSLSLLVMYRLV